MRRPNIFNLLTALCLISALGFGCNQRKRQSLDSEQAPNNLEESLDSTFVDGSDIGGNDSIGIEPDATEDSVDQSQSVSTEGVFEEEPLDPLIPESPSSDPTSTDIPTSDSILTDDLSTSQEDVFTDTKINQPAGGGLLDGLGATTTAPTSSSLDLQKVREIAIQSGATAAEAESIALMAEQNPEKFVQIAQKNGIDVGLFYNASAVTQHLGLESTVQSSKGLGSPADPSSQAFPSIGGGISGANPLGTSNNLGTGTTGGIQ